MADSYILNIKPTISASDGRKLESDLNGRFARVAKKFGGALRTVGSKLRGIIAGGAVAGISAMIVFIFTFLVNNKSIKNQNKYEPQL